MLLFGYAFAIALVLGNTGASATKEMCIFVLASPGSGSSTMVELLGRHTDCEISGENTGEYITLARFDEELRQTDAQPRSNAHSEAAWRKVYKNKGAIVEAERQLVLAQLNPSKRACWGFKEIRYGRNANMRTFASDLQFLRQLCANPRFILHTRSNLTAELNSHVLKDKKGMEPLSREQAQCFDAYATRNRTQAASLAPNPGCVGTGDTRDVFRHKLEDYIERNANEARLWSFLGLPQPGLNETHIKLSGS